MRPIHNRNFKSFRIHLSFFLDFIWNKFVFKKWMLLKMNIILSEEMLLLSGCRCPHYFAFPVFPWCRSVLCFVLETLKNNSKTFELQAWKLFGLSKRSYCETKTGNVDEQLKHRVFKIIYIVCKQSENFNNLNSLNCF